MFRGRLQAALVRRRVPGIVSGVRTREIEARVYSGGVREKGPFAYVEVSAKRILFLEAATLEELLRDATEAGSNFYFVRALLIEAGLGSRLPEIAGPSASATSNPAPAKADRESAAAHQQKPSRKKDRQAPPGIEPMLTISEAAKIAAVSVGTLYRWLADPSLDLRELVIRLPGGRQRVPAWQFQKWLKRRHGKPV